MLDVAALVAPFPLVDFHARGNGQLQCLFPPVGVVVKGLAVAAGLFQLPGIAVGVLSLFVGEGFEGFLQGRPAGSAEGVLFGGGEIGDVC